MGKKKEKKTPSKGQKKNEPGPYNDKKPETPETPETPSERTPPGRSRGTPTRKLGLSPATTREAEEQGLAMGQLFIPKVRKAIAGHPTTAAKMRTVVESHERAKRNLSDLSATSDDPPAKRNSPARTTFQSSHKEGSQEFQNDIHEQSGKAVSAYIKSQEQLLRACNEALLVLKEHWFSGEAKYPAVDFRENVRQLEIKINNLNAGLAATKAHKYTFQGSLAATAIVQRCYEYNAFAIDLLVSRHQEPADATVALSRKRDRDDQSRFRRRVFKEYGVEGNSSTDTKGTWCVISGRYIQKYEMSQVVAAHIVRHNVGEVIARHMFGDADDRDGHLMSPRNGLPMRTEYEELFDNAQIVLVPTDATKTSFKVRVLNDQGTLQQSPESLCTHPDDPWGQDLDGAELKFLNDFRPAARYLYYSFTINMIRRARHRCPGHEKDSYVDDIREIWATPGKYLRTSTLKVLAQEIGHLSADETAAIASQLESEDFGESYDPTLLDSLVAHEMVSKLRLDKDAGMEDYGEGSSSKGKEKATK
ncbi:hypothetical protein GGR56DRAFT_150477 [Xylariaceae sp. FL0804]|nr:hypothetical protein GGR56DRAFT_150477 [Xylariaceae sp. FL0804]